MITEVIPWSIPSGERCSAAFCQLRRFLDFLRELSRSLDVIRNESRKRLVLSTERLLRKSWAVDLLSAVCWEAAVPCEEISAVNPRPDEEEMANAFLRRMQNDQEWPWEEKAREELNEIPQNNEQNLAHFKEKIIEYSKKHPKFRPQLDDDLLMAYLRTCKFDLQIAMECFKKFNRVRLCHPERIFPVGKGPRDYMKYYKKPVVTLLKHRNPLDGTIVFVYSFRNFDPVEDVVEDVFNAVFAILMEIVIDPSVQAHGVRFIVDHTGVNYAVIKNLIGKMYYNKASQMAQESCPILYRGLHALETPRWLVGIINTILRPFISKEIRESIHFHGSIEEMHQFISPSILPDTFGGTAGLWEGTWMKEAIEERHDEVVRKSYYGFIDI